LSFAQYEQLESAIEESGKKLFISDSYATRKGKGTHRAIRKAQQLLQRNEWYLKMDISGYFASIDHAILLQTLGKKLKDPKMLQLVKTIVDHPQFETVGLPIGNLTSQFFANVYLDPFDHWVKDGLGTKGYMRYMDDFVFFSQEKEELKKLRKKVEAKLDTCFHLQTKASATQLNTRLHGLGFLGMRVFPAILRLRGKNLRRSLGHLRLRERQWKDGSLPEPNFLQSAQSIMGHLGGANTLRLRRALFG
ncbi:MAG TPA: reverse transcriptase domain-containing protein, partial [Thermotogota bacterium]|nr:reverse transcriptase domain-containing protein [Thermotogota bacterium]